MIDETQQDQAALFALGMLEGDEAAAFRAALAKDSELREFVDQMGESAAALVRALPVTEAPPGVMPRLLSKISAERPAPSTASRIPWAVAACFAVLAGVFGGFAIHAKREVSRIAAEKTALAAVMSETIEENQRLAAQAGNWNSERDNLENQIRDLRQRGTLAQMKISTLTAKVKTYEKVVALALWDSRKQEGLVHFDHLPQPAAGKDYQLWVIDPALKAPVSAGVLAIEKSGASNLLFKPASRVGVADKFAVSVERKGGAPSPQGEIVLMGDLTNSY